MSSEKTENPDDHLLRALRVTSTARFGAAQRLRRHETYSLWSISLCSLFVILVSILEPFGIKLTLPTNIVNLSLVAASSVILVVSIIVNGEKYGERAEKMHNCAMEINTLAAKLEESIFNKLPDKTGEIRLDYEQILKRYENHSDIDFEHAKIRRYSTHYKVGWLDRVSFFIKYHSAFLPYFILLISIFIYSYCLIFGVTNV